MDFNKFERHDRLAVVGELRIAFAGGAWDEDRIFVGNYDLHDLLSSQFALGWEGIVSCGVFRIVFERVSD